MTTARFDHLTRFATAMFALFLMTDVSTVKAQAPTAAGTTLRFAAPPSQSKASAPVRMGSTLRFAGTPDAQRAAAIAGPGTTLRFAAAAGTRSPQSSDTVATRADERPARHD